MQADESSDNVFANLNLPHEAEDMPKVEFARAISVTTHIAGDRMVWRRESRQLLTKFWYGFMDLQLKRH